MTAVPDKTMQQVFDEARTPHKYGIVLQPGPAEKFDCPSVFRHGDRWYMVYISFNNVGYNTHLAASDNLLDWRPLGTILKQRKEGWDANQVAGYIALEDTEWGGSYHLGTHDDRHWLSYLGGALPGYETDPLAMGMAWTRTPDKPVEWTRIDENPVLHRDQPNTRWWEKKTLYKSNVIHDPARSLGKPYVMFYNGKAANGVERIGMAISNDMIHWERRGLDPLIDNSKGISGDPQVVRMGEVWVMFYFGAFWKPKAFDTFACSYDLQTWTKWTGPHLVEPTEPWDATYAHKPWLVKHNDVVYHFYCAVGSKGRAIALATSKELS